MRVEYFCIQKWEKDEQKRDVIRGLEDDMVFFIDDRLTFCDGVPTVDAWELEDNSPNNAE